MTSPNPKDRPNMKEVKKMSQKFVTAVMGLSLKYRPVIEVKSNNCCCDISSQY